MLFQLSFKDECELGLLRGDCDVQIQCWVKSAVNHFTSLLFFFLGVANLSRDFSTQRWFIGTMCAVALLTLVALVACFVRKNKGGKYAGTPPPQLLDMSSMEKGQLDVTKDVSYCQFILENKSKTSSEHLVHAECQSRECHYFSLVDHTSLSVQPWPQPSIQMVMLHI